MKRIDARLLVAIGLLIFAGSCFMNLHLDQDYAAPQLFWPNVVRALGQAIVHDPAFRDRNARDCARARPAPPRASST